MVKYTFKADNDTATRKVANFIEGFIPKVSFKLISGDFGLEIECEFDDESERDNFIASLNKGIGVNDKGEYPG